MAQDQTPLNTAALRLKGSDAAIDEIIGKLQLHVNSRIKAGEPRRRGGIHVESGVNAHIADAANPGAMMKQVRAFIQECIKHGPTLFPAAVDAEIAVGFSVGDSVQFVATVELLPADIRDLATVGIAFSVAAYPSYDEASGTTNPN